MASTDIDAINAAAPRVQNVAVFVALNHRARQEFYASDDDCCVFSEKWEVARRLLQNELVALRLLFDTKPAAAAVYKTAVLAMVKTVAANHSNGKLFGFGEDEPLEDEDALNLYWS